MWSSKMAVRWRGKDGELNAGNSDFLTSNTTNELLLSRRDMEAVDMDAQSCMDHSILAIFEDSTVTSEDKSGAEEERETLLSALSEMLDSVEDDDVTLSPFDTLPDTKLLIHPECRENSVSLSLSERLRSRSKTPNVTLSIKMDADEEAESKLERTNPSHLFKKQTLIHSQNMKAEAEVEIFTSTSLVNLVKLMHPYCLKLRVEEGDKLKNQTFSQEEVWKYERPSEESDEEINVVSDEEVEDSNRKDEKRDNDSVLKSALLNGPLSRTPPSREKKRVSFGPVQVVSLDELEEEELNEKNLTIHSVSVPLNNTKANENPAGCPSEPQTPTSEINNNMAGVSPLKGETKVKSLSLQEYRQLRQKRQPLVEKQGNNTTKWPCVSEPPTELTPICLHRQNSCCPQAAHHHPDSSRSGADHISPTPPRPNPCTHARRSGLKRPRTESKPGSLQPDLTVNPNVSESKKSPVKKPLSIDPPNPVLLPLPASQTTSPTTDHSASESKLEFTCRDSDSIRHFPQIQTESSGTSPHIQPPTSWTSPEVLLVNQGYSTLFQEIKNKLAEIASGVTSRPQALCATTTQTKSSSELQTLQPQRSSPNQTIEVRLQPKNPPSPGPDPAREIKHPSLTTPPSPVDAPTPGKETLSEVPPSFSALEKPADSGIEAPDLTSLLEQFEETQAQGVRGGEKELKLATSSSNVLTGGPLDRIQPAVEALEPNPKPLRDPPHFADIPEPLGTDIILSTQLPPARRKNPLSKAIQIIDPRPLPSKKTHTNLPELPAARLSPHMYSAVFIDHDYCGSTVSAAQHCRTSKPKDELKAPNEIKVTTSASTAAAECKKQTSSCDVNPPIRAVDDSVKTSRPTDKDFSKNTATEQDCSPETPPCTLPTPPPSPPSRGRERRRYRSPCSDSSSASSSSSSSCSSASPSPKRQKRRHKRSESSSCSSSSPSVSRSPTRRYRWSYSRRSKCSRSRSRSWSQSRSPSRSRSPRVYRGKLRDVYSRESRKLRREHEIRIQKLKAIDERRVVYVGRICRSMTHEELRERFCQFGEVECVSLHFRDRGDHYAFVTFYNMDDAFAAIDNGGKLRKPNELPFDICFGGRRQFCNSQYADLDANKDAEPYPVKSRFEDLDFDSLLKQAQKGIKS
ncbi:peroxisome proliferator-activated receptor gamma coactivator-related protein 1-like isoform X2 [Eleginops maclovinus]|uniref:peroxisome proliferator-activated receptor gamma coactivator-related protein 1-like isoform X2 n=1 Tax=Eleginops maclovinus TaxID=56733 RepID=UPI003080C70B